MGEIENVPLFDTPQLFQVSFPFLKLESWFESSLASPWKPLASCNLENNKFARLHKAGGGQKPAGARSAPLSTLKLSSDLGGLLCCHKTRCRQGALEAGSSATRIPPPSKPVPQFRFQLGRAAHFSTQQGLLHLRLPGFLPCTLCRAGQCPQCQGGTRALCVHCKHSATGLQPLTPPFPLTGSLLTADLLQRAGGSSCWGQGENKDPLALSLLPRCRRRN